MTNAEFLTRDLPDPESAKRFLAQLSEKHPSQSIKLLKTDALLSDVLTLVSFSPLLATTLLQNPEYFWWLNRKRADSAVRDKQEMLESLARFSLTNSQVEPHVALTRFRRRELMRIYLRDIRRLATVSEITEEISNLADAILEHALRLAPQELDNRFGSPLETDEKDRKRPAEFCVVSLGKLGSRELNYASDIDLLFIYSGEGSTSGSGTRGTVTNREYFVKLAESITKLVGGQAGEGAAYRVDMRLRPHGRVGPLAMSVADTARYYKTEAAAWERQVLIRSRASAGAPQIFKRFISSVENAVFSREETVENALRSVGESKQKIDLQNQAQIGFDVKLGVGGIREIEFIAQALQLAYAGRDKWLRSPHTLISIARLADRKLLSKSELTELFDAYEFLRHLEHILQMENGLQTHAVPNEKNRRRLIAARMSFTNLKGFEKDLSRHTGNVNRVFRRVFAETEPPVSAGGEMSQFEATYVESSASAFSSPPPTHAGGSDLAGVSPRFAEMLAEHPDLINSLPNIAAEFPERDYSQILQNAIEIGDDFRHQIGELRRTWTRLLLEIIVFDVNEKLTIPECKRLQTALAEASISAAIFITKRELERRYSIKIHDLPLAVLGLGKLGGGGMDYDSDLDLVMVYDDAVGTTCGSGWLNDIIPTPVEFHARAVEIFVNVLSAMTRDGSLYRVDLRLRPYGNDGTVAISRNAFAEYMRSTAAIWEMLAFVKLRGVGGDSELATTVENEIRNIIHERASKIDAAELATETRNIRLKLEQQKTGRRRSKDIDIKFGPGGMLDIYFAIRYLQLRDNIPDEGSDRSTLVTLDRIGDHYRTTLTGGSSALTLNSQLSTLNSLREGYDFLSALDHNLRLTVGRTTRLPLANTHALSVIAKRMKLKSIDELLEQLTVNRLGIREGFDNVVGNG